MRRILIAAWFIHCVLIAGTLTRVHARSVEAQAKTASRKTSPHLLSGYATLPLSFEPNAGQAPDDVQFLARGNGYGLMLLRSGEAVLGLSASKSAARELRMKLLGASASAAEGREAQPGRSNYFIGNQPDKWRTNIPHYRRVAYRSVYPGIDLVYHGIQRNLEFDFVLAAGADPAAIRMSISGARRIRLDRDGDLVVQLATAVPEVRFKRPVVYQQLDGVTQTVDGRYVVRGSHVGFAVGRYEKTQPLVIDPVIAYSTYLGGTSDDFGQAIAVDSSGNAYVAGYTIAPPGFPVTPGAVQPTFGGGRSDAFVTKLSADGSTLIYSTYLGGVGGIGTSEVANAVAVDGSGNAYVTGSTDSGTFPTTPGALQGEFGGGTADAFVTKLNPSGSALVYSTYLGRTKDEGGYGIAVDVFGNAHVTGITNGDFWTTSAALQTVFGGGPMDAFVTTLSDNGRGLIYSTYLGGPGNDFGLGIATDPSGNAYVTGFTNGNYPTTAGAFQRVFGGAQDAFVTALNDRGSAAIYSTYLGGAGQEVGNAIAVDAFGDAYVTGYAAIGFPTTAGSYRPTTISGPDAFVTHLDASGSALVYSTFLGPGAGSAGYGITIDSAGAAHVAGSTNGGFPVTADAVQPNFGGGSDAFVTTLNPAGSALAFSTYLGGADDDIALGIAVDASGNYYITGQTAGGFPVTGGSAQPAFGGGFRDAFIAKIGLPRANRAPVAADDSYRVEVDTSVNVGAPGVLANDTDADAGTTLTSILVAPPAHGMLTLTANGAFTYTPAPGYIGADIFTYKANDGAADSNVASVGIDVAPRRATDLSISISDSPDPVRPGGLITYAIEVTNNGPFTDAGVNVSVSIAGAGAVFVSPAAVLPGGDPCAIAATTFTCTRGKLVAGQTATLTLQARPVSEGIVRLDASIAGEELESNPPNNSATATTLVIAPPPAQLTLAPIFTAGASYRVVPQVPPIGPIFTAGASYRIAPPALTLAPIFTAGASYQIVNTQTGSPVTIVLPGGLTLTFATVTAPGVTSVTPIPAATAGPLPPGYVEFEGLAFDVTTTATVTGPIAITFAVPSAADAQVFASLRVLHGEAGALVDRTVLTPGDPIAPNFATKTIGARVSSLSPFVIARRVAPVPPTDVGALGVKRDAVRELAALVVRQIQPRHRDNLRRAIGFLTASVHPTLWIDPTHPRAFSAALVFELERLTVIELAALTHHVDAIGDVIARIVGADRQLASVAIDDATAENGAIALIDKARRELIDADRDAEAGRPGRAIAGYRDAWAHAKAAVVTRRK